MEDKDYLGKLVYLTIHSEKWLKELSPAFNIPMANRLAKVIKVFDWDTEEGKLLLQVRESTGKWSNYNSKDFKFVLKIYYPELILKSGKVGFCTEEVFPKTYPNTQYSMFELVPDWMLKDIFKTEVNSFTVELKGKD